MSDPAPWPKEEILAVVEMLDVLEQPDFEPCVWLGGERVLRDGKEVITMPYAEYHPAVNSMYGRFIGRGGWIDPYLDLPEDPPGFDPKAEFPIEFLETASIDQIRRYLSHVRRIEPIWEGSIAGQIKRGFIPAALRRLKALAENMPEGDQAAKAR